MQKSRYRDNVKKIYRRLLFPNILTVFKFYSRL